jgi:AcrR family transcriptional regulator
MPASDLTAAARIRDAALRRFAARGVAATSIRDVARAARVSPGLVQHHFRSKEGLRRAVEDFVVREATEAFGQPIAGDSATEASTRIASRISAFIRTHPAMFAYVGRSLLEGDATGLELCARLLVLARAQVDRLAGQGLFRADLDLDWTALHVVLIDVGAYLLEPGVSRYLGAPLLGEAGLARMEKATTALFLKGIYRPAKTARRTRRRSRGRSLK